MRPTMRLSRDIGLVGNAVLILAIVLLTSAKSRSLSKQDPSQKLPSLEKVMRRDITPNELAAHALPGDLWLAVDGMVCDITDFTQVHPGGADLLLEFAGKDVTEQFQEVGHSEFAMDLIRSRLVGTLVEGNGEGGPGASALLHGDGGAGRGFLAGLKGGAKKVLPAQVFALFTREDPYNLHKILGFAVIGHFFVRWGLAVSGKWMEMGPFGDPMMFDTSVFSLASAWLCVLLQVSSFQFVLPRNRVLGRPMLWQEWRAHNLIFVLRSLIAFTANWTCKRYVTTQQGRLAIDAVCFLTVFGQLYFADVASRALRDSKHESLTASWPLWDGCPVMVERFLKFYYSIGINQLTSMTLGCGEGGWMLMQTFCGVLILQTDSFAMTLVRKNIISTASFHGYYLWNMWALAFLGLHTFGVVAYRFAGRSTFFFDLIIPMWGIPISVYIVRYLGLSKYGCWAGFMVRILAMEFTEWGRWCWLTPIPVWALWAVAQLLLSGYVFEYRVRRFLEGGRPKPLVLRSREKVSGSLFRLCFDMPAGYNCGMMPGQHMRVLAPNISKGKDTWNGQANLEKEASDLSRSYTPISSPDASTMEILVKHYPCDASCGCPQGGRVSTFLIDQLAVGGEVLASGPHGQRIYFGNGLFEVEVGKPKVRPRTVAFLAGGSGITPALSVMREMQVEAKRKESKVEAWRMMDYENEVGVTGFHVLHANRSSEDTLPLSLYAPKSSPIPVHVSNLATRAKLGSESLASDVQEEAGNKWELKYGEVTAEAVAAAFPQPFDDILVILCGPHGFITNVCLPFVKKLGYKHVIAMW